MKHIWITGASSGIGAELALQLQGPKNLLILSGRNISVLEEFKSNAKSPELIHIVAFDLNNPKEVQKASEEVISKFGFITQIFHCGGISQRSEVSETDLEVSRKLMEINFFSTTIITKAILPSMIERNEGDIVLLSSLAGKFGSPLRSSYCASKHALHGYYESLRYELKNTKINILLVTPGFISTNIATNALAGNGNPTTRIDDHINQGTPPDVCARKIIKATNARKKEVSIGGVETISLYVKRFFPSILPFFVDKNQNS